MRLADLNLKLIRLHAHPWAWPVTVSGCMAWFLAGLTTDTLTNALSIWAIVLSMMLLTKMSVDDEASERRWAATEAKLDELIKVTDGAREDLLRAEDQTVEAIEAKRC